ncbi:Site-specific recombinase XerD [Desulfofundulus australicus DSM 11792]|jgi:site-specific recombinase XerD|uniref:Site-specific recombinase XerD n=1 Tax=Desulfofundulus australicus DSM 11792 TaxID=1121425 RepID=A0A1M5DDA7_9FIRM|nr:tyrosine-type recombinase/integrase [Desulfofundulus australicus]SHF65033.1 Site-specific recombinase XerD [Desulfofundulus australicus DSM 11792]
MAKGKVLRIRKEVPATWEEARQQFLWWKQGDGISETTLNDYRYHIGQFFKRYPQAYDPKNLKKCVLEYMSQDMKPATYNIRLEYLNAFFKWCVQEGIFPENPLAGKKKRKDEGRVVNLDVETLKQLLTLPDRKTFAGLRDYALFLLTMDTGIRPKEAFSLLLDDFNFKALQVTIRRETAKTRVSRTLPISPATANAVRELIAARHPSWKDNVPVFCTVEGMPLNRNSWGYRLKMYSRKLGVKVRPYDLRHAFAILYLRSGGLELSLQKTLGHTTLAMTRRYANLVESDLRRIHAEASPLNTILPKKARVVKVRG